MADLVDEQAHGIVLVPVHRDVHDRGSEIDVAYERQPHLKRGRGSDSLGRQSGCAYVTLRIGCGGGVQIPDPQSGNGQAGQGLAVLLQDPRVEGPIRHAEIAHHFLPDRTEDGRVRSGDIRNGLLDQAFGPFDGPAELHQVCDVKPRSRVAVLILFEKELLRLVRKHMGIALQAFQLDGLFAFASCRARSQAFELRRAGDIGLQAPYPCHIRPVVERSRLPTAPPVRGGTVCCRPSHVDRGIGSLQWHSELKLQNSSEGCALEGVGLSPPPSSS